MHDYLLMQPSKYAEELSAAFGYSETLFLAQDFIIIKGENRKKVLQEIWKNKNKKTIFYAESAEMLRFVLEETAVDIIMVLEGISQKDSLHYLRSGLDQVICQIAAEKGKIIAFSFNEILHSRDRGRLLGRMAFNLSLCQKYNVSILFSSFSTHLKELRSAQDLQALQQVLENKRNIYK